LGHYPRGIDECAVSTRTREATAQMRAAGVEIYPGERLRYVVVDTQAKEAPRRVREAEINPGSGYDAEEYIRLLRLAAAEVLNTYDARRPGVPAAEQLPLPF